MSLGCVYGNGLCNQLSSVTKLNRLNERDLGLDVSVSQNFIPGIDLNVMLFENYGYIMNSTSILKDLLDAGLRRLYLDVYWDADFHKWHLCPMRPVLANSSTPTNATTYSTGPGLTQATDMNPFGQSSVGFNSTLVVTQSPVPTSGRIRDDSKAVTMEETMLGGELSPECDFELDFEAFVDALNQYITLSDTNIAASLILLHLRPKVWPSLKYNVSHPFYSTKGQPSLNTTLSSILGSRILTPGAVKTAEVSQRISTSVGVSDTIPVHERWPSLKSVLYTLTSRLVVSFNDTLQESVPDLKSLSSIAFASTPTVSNPTAYSVDQLSKLNFTDAYVSDFSGWIDARKAGVSPVISNSNIDIYGVELQELLEDHDYWAWAPNEPILYDTEDREAMLSSGYSKSVQLDACAVMSEHGMEVADCNSHFPVLCRNKTNSFHWTYADDTHTYFDPECPKHFEFAIPATPLEARMVRQILSSSSSQAAWVDFNSLYLPNCWVTGGTNAVCPYNVRQDGRNGIGYIAVVAVVSFVALCGIFLLEWDRGKSPLMRKNMKRDKPRTAEYEGVPS